MKPRVEPSFHFRSTPRLIGTTSTEASGGFRDSVTSPANLGRARPIVQAMDATRYAFLFSLLAAFGGGVE